MRTVLGILALGLVLLLLEFPEIRRMGERSIFWLVDWASERGSASSAKATPEDPAPAVQTTAASQPESAGDRVAGLAEEDCAPVEGKQCDIRKRRSCGPVSLAFSSAPNGEKRCERATVTLPRTEVIPMLRQMRCVLIGEDTQVRFSTENYLSQQGPSDGDTIEVHNGSSDVIVYGHYERRNELARVTFENVGPGASVLLKCEAFGPA